MTQVHRKPPARWPSYRRVPPFVPVPLRRRRDGWTAARQGRFIGYLAQTGSVREAAARVGCSRETVYRLRRKPGAASFSAAWDAVLAIRKNGNRIPPRKVTPDELPARAFDGPIRVRMYRGRFAAATRQPDNTALLQLLAQYNRSLRLMPEDRWPRPGRRECDAFCGRSVSPCPRPA
ncbi:hypothetical protein NT2_01_02520 [Caenibius tardaugens NBRC 16725]|uniref:Insertion element IS150 protein InsJ-like helix-turn-helix domain-containing protein n=1 Tax=Caenibius tardaugens NBRC 16725 TaxID=1219035 RepID=U2ZY75_9SPHN|nr:helix-turn-helix domain-containing protein [Caenibius tardaugens]AZI37269.1 hypothetical protein EGO55_15895 [Caenibius tardaugens NBRC 16725]GAD47483.1 hypothetical protein NT2_01_02520 [Caenibius tardaugens NBRC 16725]